MIGPMLQQGEARALVSPCPCQCGFQRNIRRGIAQKGHGSVPNFCYFFLAGALVAAPFPVVAGDTATTGEIAFLGCLGFLASRFPRVALFANVILLNCRSRKRQPYRVVWALLALLSRFIFSLPVMRLAENVNQTGRNGLADPGPPPDHTLTSSFPRFFPSNRLLSAFGNASKPSTYVS